MKLLRHTLPGMLPVALALGSITAACPAARAAGTTPSACSGPEFRQFDFWIGDWDVQDADGKPTGTNHVERVVGGCALMESWKGASGSEGRSLNLWDATDRQWHQIWVDSRGARLELAGGIANGRMVMTGESATSRGGKVLNRITWTKVDDRRVEQRWEVSADGGGTWTDAFWGLYVRRGSAGKP